METYTCTKMNLSHSAANEIWFNLPTIVSISCRVKLLWSGPRVVERDVHTSVRNSGGVVRVMRQVSMMWPRIPLTGPMIMSVSLSKLMGSWRRCKSEGPRRM